MENYLPWIIAAFVGIVFFWVWASIRAASGDRRYAADMAAKASAVAAREAATATREAASIAAQGQKERASILGFIGALAAIAVVIVLAVVMVQGIKEAGRNHRYETRHNTLIELDFGRTVRSLAVQETMREKAWADAYAGNPPRRGPSGAQSAVIWALVVFLVALVGYAVAVRSARTGP